MANNANGFKVDMVDMEEAMRDSNGQMMGEAEASVGAIPDLDKLTSDIIDILEYLDQPDVKQMCKKNNSVIRMHLINKYADSVPLNFIDLFMDEDEDHKRESVERTMRWIEGLTKVKAGEAGLEETCQAMAEEVNKRYVYDKYGGKEAFEAELQKELEKEQKGSKNRTVGF